MTAEELRKCYVGFFTERGHKEIASASLLPENDPTVLFTTAGMHPLVPYLLGEKHPLGRRLTDVQKCVRTCDIEEVGDDSHLTFFEMLGNWSLGDYFKEESISMSFDFLTKVLKVPVERLAVTAFEGDERVGKDIETAEIWKRKGLMDDQIFFYGAEENWWGPVGQTGPCGPDTEIFYDFGQDKCSDSCGPACHCGKYVEIWNNVFMEYKKEADKSLTELSQKNVDTGMGFERMLTICQGKTNVYDTELFTPVMERLQEILTEEHTEMSMHDKRVLCEHSRAMCFILGDDRHLVPSNTEQGYILRRLIRRMIRVLKKAGLDNDVLNVLADIIIEQYKDVYTELGRNGAFILEQLKKECDLFSKTLDGGLKKAESYLMELTTQMKRTVETKEKVEQSDDRQVSEEQTKIKMLSGSLAFKLYDTYGFPIEFTCELAKEKGCTVDLEGFETCFLEHQEKSRQGSEGKFKGGLADHSTQTARLHTATHLLHAALRQVLGEQVQQRGSNITAERLRFDFSYPVKVTKEELTRVEDIVNTAIAEKCDVIMTEMSVEEAKRKGAIGLFANKYGEQVKVYEIPGFSMEICGGPHAKNTGDLICFRILKEEASSAGVRRIKAVLEE